MPGFIVRLVLYLILLISQRTDLFTRAVVVHIRCHPDGKNFIPRGEKGDEDDTARIATHYNR